jgi:hypothetical protein
MQGLQGHQEHRPQTTLWRACGVRLTHWMRRPLASAVWAGRATSLTAPAPARPR